MRNPELNSDQEDNPLSSYSGESHKSKARTVLVIAVVIVAVAVLGKFGIDAIRDNTAISNQKEVDEKNRKAEADEKEKQFTESALSAIRTFVGKEFQGWKYEGDNLDRSEISLDYLINADPKYFFVHLSQGEKSKVVRLAYVVLRRNDRSEYFHVYAPEMIELGNFELEKIKRDHFKAGQESPP